MCSVYALCCVYTICRERERERREHKIHIFDVLSWILLYILWKWILWSGWMVFLFYFVFDISKGVVYSACILHNVSEAHINIRTKIMLVENIRKKNPFNLIQSTGININTYFFTSVKYSCHARILLWRWRMLNKIFFLSYIFSSIFCIRLNVNHPLCVRGGPVKRF